MIDEIDERTDKVVLLQVKVLTSPLQAKVQVMVTVQVLQQMMKMKMMFI